GSGSARPAGRPADEPSGDRGSGRVQELRTARGPRLPGRPGANRLEARPEIPRRIFGAHAAHLRAQLLRCSLTNQQCARSAARRFARIWATWLAESLAEGFRRASAQPVSRLLLREVAAGHDGRDTL